MRSSTLAVLVGLALLSGCKSSGGGGDGGECRMVACGGFAVRRPGWMSSELPAVRVDVAALASTNPAVAWRANRVLREALGRDALVDLSADPAVAWCLPARGLHESVAAVERRAALLVERGDLETAIWELERVGSTSPVLRVARELMERAGPPGATVTAHVDFAPPQGWNVVRSECVVGGVLIVQAVREGTSWLLGLGEGGLLWKRPLGAAASEAIPFTPVVRGGRVFLGAVDRAIALDAATGEIAWVFQRRAWDEEDGRPWNADSPIPFELRVTHEAVELIRGAQHPRDTLDPRTGRRID
ncbi:MAG: PQQ-binding-like beta-propeller repeat protein [Planctomycetota bacterium]